MDGYTYFIQDGEEAIKIGASGAPRLRLQHLQTSNHRTLKLMAMVPESIAEEQDCHRRFSHLHIRGEWFRPGPDLLAFIESVRQPPEKRRRWIDVSADVGRLIKLRSAHIGNPAVTERLCIAVGQLRNWSTTQDYQHRLQLVQLMKQTRAELAELGVAA